MSSCSVISSGYHNLTARDNSYFLARERMKEVDQTFFETREDDYNRVLKVYPKLDSTFAQSVNSKLEDILKKASRPIQYHPGSNWTDNSYILVGKVRYYQYDLENAILTYKYVNSNFNSPKEKHEALIQLALTYLQNDQLRSAKSAINFLNTQKIHKDNLKHFYLMKAYYYQLSNDPKKVLLNLRRSIPYINNKDERARVNFIIGQIYQKLGMNNNAYVHYKIASKNNPPYEIEFHSKLNMAQTVELNRKKDIEEIEKEFLKMLEDEKNEEYRDRIYLEIAKFEHKKGNINEALDNIGLSLAEGGSETQKGYAYLQGGSIYYNDLRNYRKAYYYYDSASKTLREDLPEYDSVAALAKILEEFVMYLDVIDEYDSLLKLSTMDSAEVAALYIKEIKKELKEEEEARKRAEELAKKEKKNQNIGSTNLNQEPGLVERDPSKAGQFYFYNPGAVAMGRTQFKQQWGNRPLEDNWRRSEKEANIEEESQENEADDELAEELEEEKEEEKEEINEEEIIAQRLTARMSKLPKSDKEVKIAKDTVATAIFEIAKLYNQFLKEPENGFKRYKEFVERFPGHEDEPEALYSLYLIAKKLNNGEASKYEALLKKKFPKNKYTKLIDNPDYDKEFKEINATVRRIYNDAYRLHERGYVERSDSLLSTALAMYPNTEHEDRLILLQTLNTAKKGDLDKYEQKLREFINLYKNSDLKPFAESLLSRLGSYQSGDQNKALVKEANELFEIQPEAEHYFMMAISGSNIKINDVRIKLSNFNTQFYANKNLRSTHIAFNESYYVLMAKKFDGLGEAMNYYNKVNGVNSPFKSLPKAGYKTFVISKDNYIKLFRNKKLDPYITFFKDNYL